MNYRNLGQSGLRVSPLCLGTMMFGSWGNADEKACIHIIHQALDSGVNFIDTANVYSSGESEEIVGKALKGRREQAVLATKVWGAMGDGPHQRGLSRKAIQEQVHHSLQRLQTDVIDLYQIHRPDPHTPWEETLSTLTDLVRQGKVRHIGCSTNHYAGEGEWQKYLPAWEIVRTLAISDAHGYERFVSLQPPYSLLRRNMELEHFPMTQSLGLGTLVWSPLEGGWLTGKYRQGQANPGDSPRSDKWVGDLENPQFEQRLEVVERLLQHTESRQMALAEFSLAWVLANPAVTSVIIGPRTTEQLESCLQAIDIQIGAEDRELIDRLVPPGSSVLGV